MPIVQSKKPAPNYGSGSLYNNIGTLELMLQRDYATEIATYGADADDGGILFTTQHITARLGQAPKFLATVGGGTSAIFTALAGGGASPGDAAAVQLASDGVAMKANGSSTKIWTSTAIP